MVITGIERLKNEKSIQDQFKGNCAILCHSASIDNQYRHSLEVMIDIFGDRLTKIFGPQHGFVTDVQDNMIETDHYTHPFFKRPVYSLYSETRIPTDQMLENIDHLFIDLQDIGTRIYTYIYTMTHILEKCADKEIEIIILDRPSPIGLKHIEGNILDLRFKSFVGRHELPVRHAMTMGEIAKFHQSFIATKKANLKIIEVKNLSRDMYFEQTTLPWTPPSPNIPIIESCFTFVGSVLLEGTNLSEGRGTTRPLELIGHPKIEAFSFLDHCNQVLSKAGLSGFILRPISFLPTFQKHAGINCGGFHIHITNRESFKAWRVFQILTKLFAMELGRDFSYKTDAYEYGDGLNPMDMINGDDRFRAWYESDKLDLDFLDKIESERMDAFLEKRQSILIY